MALKSGLGCMRLRAGICGGTVPRAKVRCPRLDMHRAAAPPVQLHITTQAYDPHSGFPLGGPAKFLRPDELAAWKQQQEAPVDMNSLSSFDWFEVPPHRIAQRPLEDRSSSRLLHLDGATSELQHLRFYDILHKGLLRSGDLLVLNNTQVIPARLLGRKSSGGGTELMLDRLLPESPSEFISMVRSPPRELPSRVYVYTRDCHPFRTGAVVHTLELVEALDTSSSRLFRVRYVGARRRIADAPDPEDKAVAWKALFEDSGWSPMWSLESTAQSNATQRTAMDLLTEAGNLPLPSYIHRQDDEIDRVQYQTVFAKSPGAMAAPTAGLHFDEPLLNQLRLRGIRRTHVTLHVGLGTFLPIKSDNVADHVMHSEFAEVPQETCDLVNETKARGGRVIAVGTTSVRSLETACLAQGLPPLDSPDFIGTEFQLQPWSGHTQLFIRPDQFDWRCVDGLITNFHVNKSTLLMLVSAFGGYENVRRAYNEALAHPKYRFFSYGDAMFINRQPQPSRYADRSPAGDKRL